MHISYFAIIFVSLKIKIEYNYKPYKNDYNAFGGRRW
jgi:hypothetical protein